MLRLRLATPVLLALGTAACAAALAPCEQLAPSEATAPIILEPVELVGMWDLQLVHHEVGREEQVDQYLARLWPPDSAIRARLRRALAVGSIAAGSAKPDSVFRWHRDGKQEPIVALDSALVIGDPPGGFDGSRDYLTVRHTARGELRGRWTTDYFGVALTIDGRVPPPDPDGYFCATRRDEDVR